MAKQLTKLLQQHCIKILSQYLPSSSQKIPNIQTKQQYNNNSKNNNGIKLPLDIHCKNYFRDHKSLGSKQKKLISDRVYQAVRYNILLNFLSKGKVNNIQYKLELLSSSDFYTAIQNPQLPKYLRASYPKILFQKIQQTYDDQTVAFNVCKAMNTRAPFTIRINPIKTTREKILKMLRNYLKYQALETEYSPYGINIIATKIPGSTKPTNQLILLHQTKQFNQGHFQIQDQGSQLTALGVKCNQGDKVLDFCAGGGGKSLAFAHFLNNRGQLYLHDIRQKSLQSAKKRFLKAGFQNVQFHCGQDTLQKMKGKMDWVVVDAPCTGTGTIRRNPDLKLRFNQKWLKDNILLQEQIVNRAMKYLNRNGKLVYITCSILRDQNEDQIKKFIQNYRLKVNNDQILKILPQKDGMDGFFSAVLSKN